MGSPVLPPAPAPALGPGVPPAEPSAPGVAAQPPPSGGGDNSGVTSGGTRGTAWLSPGLRSPRGAARGGGPLPAALRPSQPRRSALRACYRKCISWRWRWGCSAGGLWSRLGRQQPPSPSRLPQRRQGHPARPVGKGPPAPSDPCALPQQSSQ